MDSGFHVADASFHTVDVMTLLATKFPPRDMVLSPWLPAKGLAMVYGPRGIGKTHLSLGIAYAVATGASFLGWRAPRPRRVLLIDGEMPGVVLQNRLAGIVQSEAKEPPSPDFLRLLAMDMQDGINLDLSDEGSHAALDAAIDGAELLIVDNISTLAGGGRENEAESWLPIQQWALRQRRAGRSVLFIHHAGKGGQQRGTSRREDVLDTVVALRKPTDFQPDEGARFEVHFEKNRGFHGDEAKPFEAKLTARGWTTRDLADADVARIMALMADGRSVREIANELGMAKSTVSRMQQRGNVTQVVAPASIPADRDD